MFKPVIITKSWNSPEQKQCAFNIINGSNLLNQNQFQAAQPFFLRAIQIDPNEHNAYFQLGNLYFSLKKYQQACQALQKSIQLQKEPDAIYYCCLNNSYIESQKYQQAIDNSKKCILKFPQNMVFYERMGFAYFKLEKYKQASQTILKVLKLNNKYISCYYQMIQIYKSSGQKEKLYQFMKQYKNNIENAFPHQKYRFYLQLAIVCNSLTKFQQASLACKQAINAIGCKQFISISKIFVQFIYSKIKVSKTGHIFSQLNQFKTSFSKLPEAIIDPNTLLNKQIVAKVLSISGRLLCSLLILYHFFNQKSQELDKLQKQLTKQFKAQKQRINFWTQIMAKKHKILENKFQKFFLNEVYFFKKTFQCYDQSKWLQFQQFLYIIEKFQKQINQNLKIFKGYCQFCNMLKQIKQFQKFFLDQVDRLKKEQLEPYIKIQILKEQEQKKDIINNIRANQSSEQEIEIVQVQKENKQQKKKKKYKKKNKKKLQERDKQLKIDPIEKKIFENKKQEQKKDEVKTIMQQIQEKKCQLQKTMKIDNQEKKAEKTQQKNQTQTFDRLKILYKKLRQRRLTKDEEKNQINTEELLINEIQAIHKIEMNEKHTINQKLLEQVKANQMKVKLLQKEVERLNSILQINKSTSQSMISGIIRSQVEQIHKIKVDERKRERERIMSQIQNYVHQKRVQNSKDNSISVKILFEKEEDVCNFIGKLIEESKQKNEKIVEIGERLEKEKQKRKQLQQQLNQIQNIFNPSKKFQTSKIEEGSQQQDDKY